MERHPDGVEVCSSDGQGFRGEVVLSISVVGCRGGKLLLWALDIAIYNSEGSMIVRKHFALEVNEVV